LTKDWILKLTDFGIARAADLSHTMTTVGTPIYMSPEVMRADRYDGLADVYSFGICLMAMVRAEKNAAEFFFECLRKHMKKKNRKGVGIAVLNNRLFSKGWRPVVPAVFRRSFPKMSDLICSCWQNDKTKRPSIDNVVARLRGDIRDEIMAEVEPMVVVMSAEDDQCYWDECERMKEAEARGEDIDYLEVGVGGGREGREESKEGEQVRLMELENMRLRKEYGKVLDQLRGGEMTISMIEHERCMDELRRGMAKAA